MAYPGIRVDQLAITLIVLLIKAAQAARESSITANWGVKLIHPQCLAYLQENGQKGWL